MLTDNCQMNWTHDPEHYLRRGRAGYLHARLRGGGRRRDRRRGARCALRRARRRPHAPRRVRVSCWSVPVMESIAVGFLLLARGFLLLLNCLL